MQTENEKPDPAAHREKRPARTADTPRFGRLLIVLLAAVLIMAAITVLSEAYYS